MLCFGSPSTVPGINTNIDEILLSINSKQAIIIFTTHTAPEICKPYAILNVNNDKQ